MHSLPIVTRDLRPRVARRNVLLGLGAAWLEGCRCDDVQRRPHQAPVVDQTLPAYLRRTDVHLHFDVASAARALELMNQEGIARGVNLSGGAPGGALEAQLQAAEQFDGRLAVFTSPHYADTHLPAFGERFERALRQAAKLGARGLKIHKALGLGMRRANGQLIPVDDPELDGLFHTAGELGLPVMIHTADPLAFWNPVDESNERRAELEAHPGWAMYGEDVPSFDELYAQYEARVARHPKTTFVGVHFGNCAEQPERVARALRRYPNLYIDTAARIPEFGRHPAAQMRTFFEEFQDRILFGSDLGVGAGKRSLHLGSTGRKRATEEDRRLFFDATRRYFETNTLGMKHPTPIQGEWLIDGIGLPQAILEKLYVSNARRVLGVG